MFTALYIQRTSLATLNFLDLIDGELSSHTEQPWRGRKIWASTTGGTLEQMCELETESNASLTQWLVDWLLKKSYYFIKNDASTGATIKHFARERGERPRAWPEAHVVRMLMRFATAHTLKQLWLHNRIAFLHSGHSQDVQHQQLTLGTQSTESSIQPKKSCSKRLHRWYGRFPLCPFNVE